MRVLLAGLGDIGGVGRVERLIEDALVDSGYEVRTYWRRHHPEYLEPRFARVQGQGGGPLGFLAGLIATAAAHRPEVTIFTHVNVARALLFGSARYGRTAIWTHGVEVWGDVGRTRPRALRRASRIISVSEFTRQELVRAHRVPASRVAVIPNAVATDWIDRPWTLTPGSSRILTVSRLSRSDREKGVVDLIHALAPLAMSLPQVRLSIVGDGDDIDFLRQTAEDVGVSDRVLFRGRLPHGELLRAYEEADVFALPSRKEGFGLVFAEAMAAGLPVVAWRSGGAPEVVRDRVSGLLVESQRELVDGLAMLLTDREFASSLGAAGKDLARSDFCFRAFKVKVASLVNTLGCESEQ